MTVITITEGKNVSLMLPSVEDKKVEISVERNAVLELGVLCLQSSSVDLHVELTGEGATAKIGAAFLGKGEETISLNAFVNHAAPCTKSDVKIYGCLSGKSRAKAIGNIKIEKNGQKADAFFASHCLLLDKSCRAESVPGLEIEANDVKAGHSASATKLSQEEVFYCRSRGLGEKEAEKLIVFGFLHRAFRGLPFKVDEKIGEKWSTL